jgi:excisionase family DNA binding protein
MSEVIVDSPLLSIEETADYLKVSISTLARMRRDKNGPQYVQIGYRVMYRKEDLDAYIETKIV